MKRKLFTFVNHACFTVRSATALLLVDPWLEGTAFNGGWRLRDQSTSNAAMVDALNAAGLPVYLWFSNEHADHFSPSFISQFKQRFRGSATFLYQRTIDKRVVGYLRRQGLHAVECAPGVPVALGDDMRLMVFPNGGGDSWAVIDAGGRTIVDLNDCTFSTVEQWRALEAELAHAAPCIDLLLTRFGYAGWAGNPDQPALHKAAAHDRINQVALQVSQLRPRLVVPVSFARFSHPDNAWLNAEQNTPQALLAAPQMGRLAPVVRFLRPGAVVDLDADDAASLEGEHEQAVAHWTALFGEGGALSPRPPPLHLADVQAAFIDYRARVAAGLHGLPRVLELTHRITPLVVHLTDLQQTVQFSYRGGFRVLLRSVPHHLSMTSNDAVFLFEGETGFDATWRSGCFRTARKDALTVFTRFFLPQRLGRQGVDRRHPVVLGRYLVRNTVGLAMRQVQAVLRHA